MPPPPVRLGKPRVMVAPTAPSGHGGTGWHMCQSIAALGRENAMCSRALKVQWGGTCANLCQPHPFVGSDTSDSRPSL